MQGEKRVSTEKGPGVTTGPDSGRLCTGQSPYSLNDLNGVMRLTSPLEDTHPMPVCGHDFTWMESFFKVSLSAGSPKPAL